MPWVSKRLYADLLASHRAQVDSLQGEIAFLREQLQGKQDHQKRLERTAAGRPETPPPPAPVKQSVEIPDEFWKILDTFDNPAISAMVHKEALEAVAKGIPWNRILETYRGMLPPAETSPAP